MSLKDIIVKIVADDQRRRVWNPRRGTWGGVAASSLTKHLAGLVTVGAFVGLAKEAIDMGSALDDASKKFGVSAEDLSELQYVAKMSGVEFEALGKSFKFLNKTVAEAENPYLRCRPSRSRRWVCPSKNSRRNPRMNCSTSWPTNFAGMKDGAE